MIGWKQKAFQHIANESNSHECILIVIFKKKSSESVDFKLNKPDGSPSEERSLVLSAAFL